MDTKSQSQSQATTIAANSNNNDDDDDDNKLLPEGEKEKTGKVDQGGQNNNDDGGEKQEKASLGQIAAEGIPKLVNSEHVMRMINLQKTAIYKLEGTNKSLADCISLAQNRLTSTTKLFKKTSKQMSDSKKDLDIVYKKITELKSKIKAERPDLWHADDDYDRGDDDDDFDEDDYEDEMYNGGNDESETTKQQQQQQQQGTTKEVQKSVDDS